MSRFLSLIMLFYIEAQAVELLEPLIFNCKNPSNRTLQLVLYNPGWPMGAECRSDPLAAISADSSGYPMACFKGQIQFSVRYPISKTPIYKDTNFSIHNFDGKLTSYWLKYEGRVGNYKMHFSFEPAKADDNRSTPTERGSIVVFPLTGNSEPVVFILDKDCKSNFNISELTQGLWIKKR